MRPPVALVCLALAACASSPSTESSTSPTIRSSTATSSTATTSTTVSGATVVNTWSPSTLDPAALPLGDALVSTSAAAVGGLFVCDSGNPNGGGAFAVGPWIDEAAGTWDMSQKVAVQGDVPWPDATFSERVTGDGRALSSNGLPVHDHTGTFPISASDPAAAYDRNPNSIAMKASAITLPTAPKVAATPTCLPKGPIGMLRNGVAMFAPVDALNRDAVAHETQDGCGGHPERSGTYHYHDVPTCIRDVAVGPSTVVGFAYDGFPIVVERDAEGALPTDADLDECHGRASAIVLDGTVVTTYHYSATLEFPDVMGCYRGTPARAT